MSSPFASISSNSSVSFIFIVWQPPFLGLYKKHRYNNVQHWEIETSIKKYLKDVSILLPLIMSVTITFHFEEDDSSPGTDEDGLMDGGLVDVVSLGKGREIKLFWC